LKTDRGIFANVLVEFRAKNIQTVVALQRRRPGIVLAHPRSSRRPSRLIVHLPDNDCWMVLDWLQMIPRRALPVHIVTVEE